MREVAFQPWGELALWQVLVMFLGRKTLHLLVGLGGSRRWAFSLISPLLYGVEGIVVVSSRSVDRPYEWTVPESVQRELFLLALLLVALSSVVSGLAGVVRDLDDRWYVCLELPGDRTRDEVLCCVFYARAFCS